MGQFVKNTLFYGSILVIYSFFFYFIVTQQLNTDFTSFYGAAHAYVHHLNPYAELSAAFLIKPIGLAINLNPPLFLQLMAPLAQFDFFTASLIWALCSLIAGIIGALIAFHLLIPALTKKYWLALLTGYLAVYPSLMNMNFSQVGDFLLFFMMMGYYFYLRGRDCWAGFFWGIIIAIKLFPALLLCFAFMQNRYKLVAMMLGTAIVSFFLPLLTNSYELFELYFRTLNGAIWYGNSWNASIYGFIFRLMVDMDGNQSLWFIKGMYLIVFIAVLFCYLKKLNRLKQCKNTHQAFCLTLVTMLLLSPFGWLYYFSLLLMPLTFVWQTLSADKKTSGSKLALWALCLFLIYFPQINVQARYMASFFYQITIYSVYFYGLIILFYLLYSSNQSPLNNNTPPQALNFRLLFPLYIIMGLGLVVVLNTLLLHFYKIPAKLLY